ncbi:MAG: hypothetical protein ABS46_04360 [Cytophagaceae bacterium SCN 52-12]|nr:MAG: hypothetical protein ABS46_04360 [Cytophagaceae bacterium SCN 52-12]
MFKFFLTLFRVFRNAPFISDRRIPAGQINDNRKAVYPKFFSDIFFRPDRRPAVVLYYPDLSC